MPFVLPLEFYDAHGECHCPEWGRWEPPHSSCGLYSPTRAADHGSSHENPVEHKCKYITCRFCTTRLRKKSAAVVWWWPALTWHCMRASCNEDLHWSSELPCLSQRLFMSFSFACSPLDSSESDCRNSALHRLMESTMGLRLSYAFCSSCKQTPTIYIFAITQILFVVIREGRLNPS